jgi:hypothetical protein
MTREREGEAVKETGPDWMPSSVAERIQFWMAQPGKSRRKGVATAIGNLWGKKKKILGNFLLRNLWHWQSFDGF